MLLRAFALGIRRAMVGIGRRPIVSLSCVGAIAVSLLLVGAVHLAGENASRLTKGWGAGVQMVVYLEPDVPTERALAIARILRGVPAVDRVDYVPPDEAERRLASSLGSHKDLLVGVETGYLPASLEVALAGGVRGVAEVSPLVDKLRHTSGVEEVELLGDWVERLAATRRSLRWLAIGLALLVAAACVYVVATTIKLGAVARKDELDILRLVGATENFVRAPLLIEGALQGALGAGVGAALLYALYRVAGPAFTGLLGGAFGPLELQFLPASSLALAVGIGAGLGALGSFIAVGRAEVP